MMMSLIATNFYFMYLIFLVHSETLIEILYFLVKYIQIGNYFIKYIFISKQKALAQRFRRMTMRQTFYLT